MADIITVAALNKYVKNLIERDDVINGIAIRGEISNFVNHQKSGHYYFTLKDSTCAVKAVMFKNNCAKLNFMPQTGMGVIVRGTVSLFERDGTFQLYVSDMFPDGEGALQMAFNELKARLEKKGLFAQEHKKPIPKMPQTVGVVTSKTGAALQDIINVLSRRFPLTKLLLCSATVQGNDAQYEIAAAIKTLDDSGKADIIIVARGGGSAEDLWVFNSEIIATTVYNCKTPVISAVGHEIDYTILDFVADLRAPTPSAGAELAVPDIHNLYKNYNELCKNIQNYVYSIFNLCYNNYQQLLCSDVKNTILQKQNQYKTVLNELTCNISKTAIQTYTNKKQKLLNQAKLAGVLNPYAVLARGYAVAEINGKSITENCLPDAGDLLNIKGQNYKIECSVINAAKETACNE